MRTRTTSRTLLLLVSLSNLGVAAPPARAKPESPPDSLVSLDPVPSPSASDLQLQQSLRRPITQGASSLVSCQSLLSPDAERRRLLLALSDPRLLLMPFPQPPAAILSRLDLATFTSTLAPLEDGLTVPAYPGF